MDLIDICIVVQGFECNQRWPGVRISIDNHVAYFGPVIGMQKIIYKNTSVPDQKLCTVDIEYFNKSNKDTVVDLQGNILSNQSVLLKELWINGVDLIKSGLIHKNVGQYTVHLSTHKKQYFVDHNINVHATTNTHMFENGVWHIELALPLLSTLTTKHNFVEYWENVDLLSIVDKLYQQLKICQELENKQVGHD